MTFEEAIEIATGKKRQEPVLMKIKALDVIRTNSGEKFRFNGEYLYHLKNDSTTDITPGFDSLDPKIFFKIGKGSIYNYPQDKNSSGPIDTLTH